MFPYATLTSRLTQPAGIVHAAAKRVVLFLGRYCVQPLLGYQGHDTGTSFDESHQPRGPVYNDGSVWLAWQDLAARVGRRLLENPQSQGSLIATHPPESCVPAESSVLRLTYSGGERIAFLVCRACDSCWPARFLDPAVLRHMRGRRGPRALAIVYEDSGHQPPIEMKRPLERTAKAAADVVLRMNTERNAHVAETCKLEPGANPGQIRFRISDGHITYHGYFTTTAQDMAEQRTALVYLSRFYREQCEREKFQLSGS